MDWDDLDFDSSADLVGGLQRRGYFGLSHQFFLDLRSLDGQTRAQNQYPVANLATIGCWFVDGGRGIRRAATLAEQLYVFTKRYDIVTVGISVWSNFASENEYY